MPSRKLTEKEKQNKRINNNVKKYMKSVRAFLANKTGGQVEEAWECSLMLLEEYYRQFLILTEKINELDDLVAISRYGEVPHPLLGARDKAAVRLESMLKQVGCTFKEAAKMDVIETVVEESPLDKFIQNKIEKR